MNTYYKFAILVCCGFIATGCGESSNDNTAPVLPVQQQQEQVQNEAEASNNFCLNNPSDSVCSQGKQQGVDLGFENYNAGQNQNGYVNQNYGSHTNGGQQYANLCGCRPGTKPVVYEGSIMCADTVAYSNKEEVIHVGVSFRKHHGKTRADNLTLDYDYIESNNSDTVFTNPTGQNNCYQQAQAGCNPYRPNQCYGFNDSYGNPVYATCQQIPGYQYGKCVPSQYGGSGSGFGSGSGSGSGFGSGYGSGNTNRTGY